MRENPGLSHVPESTQSHVGWGLHTHHACILYCMSHSRLIKKIVCWDMLGLKLLDVTKNHTYTIFCIWYIYIYIISPILPSSLRTVALRRDAGRFLDDPQKVYDFFRKELVSKQVTIPNIYWCEDEELLHASKFHSAITYHFQ